jgi:hypothetical protein
MWIAFILALSTHVVLSVRGCLLLSKSSVLTSKQKVINYILLWLIPLVIYLIIVSINKRQPGTHEVERKPGLSSGHTNINEGISIPDDFG